ncbi:MAG: hypothetical protein IKP35_04470 [Alphaproteobacteria bacterium]|nr:hypothetical protein [Alphaproteobacteria bacterium]
MKKYIITDPCYLIQNDDWDKCCEIFNSVAYKKAEENRDYEMQRELFDNEITAVLRKYSGDYKAQACSTGYGDWTNEIWGKNIIKHDFFADSGMCCVCELTDSIQNHISKNSNGRNEFNGMAVFETDKDIAIEFDTSDSDWTVIRVKDKNTGNVLITSSEPYSDDDE